VQEIYSSQGFAARILDLNHELSIEFEANAAKWQEHQNNTMSPNSGAYLEGEGFEALVEMGPSILSHVMAKYADDHSWCWSFLLQQIIHGIGHVSGTIFSDQLYEYWKAWYEGEKSDGTGPRTAADGFISHEDFFALDDASRQELVQPVGRMPQNS